MSKKWYNYFVTVESEEQKKDPSSELPQPEEANFLTVTDMIPESAPTELEMTAKLQPSANGPADFSTIFDAVGIQPPAGGFDIYKVEEMLSSEHLKDMPTSVKKNAVLVALEAARVPIEDVIKDAVQRDRALDAFEKIERDAVDNLDLKKAEENKTIQDEIDQFLQEKRAIIEANNKMVQESRERFKEWQLLKQQEEQRIFEIVAHFISPNPITTTTNKAIPPPLPAAQDFPGK